MKVVDKLRSLRGEFTVRTAVERTRAKYTSVQQGCAHLLRRGEITARKVPGQGARGTIHVYRRAHEQQQ